MSREEEEGIQDGRCHTDPEGVVFLRRRRVARRFASCTTGVTFGASLLTPRGTTGVTSALRAPRNRSALRFSHGTTTLGSYLPQATRAGPRREFQSPIRGRGLRRATSVQTPIAVRAKLASGRHAPLRGRPLCPRQTPCTRLRERTQPRVVPCASVRRRRRGGNLHASRRGQSSRTWADGVRAVLVEQTQRGS